MHKYDYRYDYIMSQPDTAEGVKTYHNAGFSQSGLLPKHLPPFSKHTSSSVKMTGENKIEQHKTL